MTQIRAFLAINLPVSMIEEIRSLQSDLRTRANNALVKVAWVPPPNMHVTLKFLGNIDEENVVSIKQRLQPVLESCSPIHISVSKTGVFPNPKKPRVIWVGIHSAEDELAQLACQIDDVLEGLGFEKEAAHPFRAHLTLGRVKRGTANLLEGTEDRAFGECSIHEVILYKSTLQRKGAEYTPLARFPLAGRSEQKQPPLDT